MDSELPSAEAAPSLPRGRFTGPQNFQRHIHEALACAAREGWRDLLLCDFNFEDWPLNTREVHDSLTAWARPGRRLTLLAVRYDEVVRRHPRFVAWRQRWDHLLDCRIGRATTPEDFLGALIGPRWFLQRLDRPRCVCVCGEGPEQLIALREAIASRVRGSAPGFPASTLGL